jgi:hypothetical protein
MSERETYPSLADYARIGDCHAAALVSRGRAAEARQVQRCRHRTHNPGQHDHVAQSDHHPRIAAGEPPGRHAGLTARAAR